MTWGANFSNDYVHDELASQNIVFPEKAELQAEGRDDLVRFAGEQVTTGDQARALLRSRRAEAQPVKATRAG